MYKFLKQQRLKIALALIVLIALMLLPWNVAPEYRLPTSLGSLSLREQVSGSEALEIINKLHEKSVTPDQNVIGRYTSDRGEATLYVSVYEADTDPERDFQKMKNSIRGGGTPFAHVREVSVEGTEIAFCLGLGQVHYFFHRQTKLFWLAVDPPIADETLLHLLQAQSMLQGHPAME